MPDEVRTIQPRTVAADREGIDEYRASKYRRAIILSLAAGGSPMTLRELKSAIRKASPDLSPDPVEHYVQALMTEHLLERVKPGVDGRVLLTQAGGRMAKGYEIYK